MTRTFDSFAEAKRENARSRVDLGIHRAFNRDEGLRTGDRVADDVFDTILQPVRGRGDKGGEHPQRTHHP